MQASTIIVTDVWGRTREAAVYPEAYDGADGFCCPFCQSVTVQRTTPRLGWPRCDNPWCEAAILPQDPTADVARALWLERAHDEALRLEDDARRKREHTYAMERIRQDNEARARETTRRAEQARQVGQCVRCAVADYYRPRFIKHRPGHAHRPITDAQEGSE